MCESWGDNVVMARLPHGYTNRTRVVGSFVEKVYDGPDRYAHAQAERVCLSALAECLPVPMIVGGDSEGPSLLLDVLPGSHGQDLLATGHAEEVLRLVGATLRSVQAVCVDDVLGLAGDGSMLVHGDFGPQNMLFDLERDRVTGILDWEFAHRGQAIEDLAWCEWIVRMHHPDANDALDALFGAYGERPPWRERHEAMLIRIRDLIASCERARQPSDWPERLLRTERWSAE